MVQPGALACTSAYAKLIKKGHRKVFYLTVRKIDSVFLFEVYLLNNQNNFYTNLSCQGMLYTRHLLLPNEGLVARGFYNLLMGDQNLKQKESTGAQKS